jgi:hypothetical protein
VPIEGSTVRSLIASNGSVINGVNMKDVQGLSGKFFVNDFTLLSVVSEVNVYERLTVHKQYLPGNELLTSVTIVPGPSSTPSYTLPANESMVTLTYPKGTKIEILANSSLAGYPLYTIGASGLQYEYRAPENSGLTLDPDPSFFSQGSTLLSIGVGLGLNGNDGPLVAFEPPLYIENRQSFINLTETAAVTSVFIPYNYVPDLTPPAPISTLLVNINASTLNVLQPEVYIIASSSVTTFTIQPDNIDGVYVTNTFTLSNFNECFLTISTSPAFSANKTIVTVGSDVTLSGSNNKFYTFSYYNTGSLILGFSNVKDQTSSRLTRITEIPQAVRPSLNSCLDFVPLKEMFTGVSILTSRNDEDKPGEGYFRHPGCLRYVIVEKRRGFRFKQIGETINNLNLKNIVRDSNSTTEFMSNDGCYAFEFEFYGWKNREDNIFVSSDTSYRVRGLRIS